MKANYFCILLHPYLVKTSYLLNLTIFFFFHEHQAQEFGTVNICADLKDGKTSVKCKSNVHTGVQTVYTIKVAVIITCTAVIIS